jgi:hypothetical protein
MKEKPEKFRAVFSFIDSVELDDLERDVVDKFMVVQFKIEKRDRSTN